MAESVTNDGIAARPGSNLLLPRAGSHGRFFAVALLGAMSLNPACARANLLTNGSFEDATDFVDNTGQDTMVLPPGSMAMPGWTVGGFVYWTGPETPSVLRAEDGGYFLNLSAPNEGGTYYGHVSQSILTNPGSTYQISFYLGSSNQYGLQDGIAAQVENSLSGGPFAAQTFTSTNPGNSGHAFNYWQLETMSFTAISDSTTVLLVGSSGLNYVGLDNVSVSQIPEPPSWAVLLMGLLCMGLRPRGRRVTRHQTSNTSETGRFNPHLDCFSAQQKCPEFAHLH